MLMNLREKGLNTFRLGKFSLKILVTGVAGFIGFHLAKTLLEKGHQVVGLDNLNPHYDALKYARLAELGIDKEAVSAFNKSIEGTVYGEKLQFVRLNLEDRELLPKLFEKEPFDSVCNLAAQAGVRHSIENPEVYVDSNLVGFLNVLECCRNYSIKHLVYASSSSVYGMSDADAFKITDNTDQPISLYAATKKSNELMAHTYSHLFDLPTTGLRFFTVYGPWGRPDMAPFLFTDAIANNKPIKVFNKGNMERDFTYIDDIVEGVIRVIETPVSKRKEHYKIYNIGNNKSVQLFDFIEQIELNLDKKAIKEMHPMQPGDVKRTLADVETLVQDYGYAPDTSIEKGVAELVKWYKSKNADTVCGIYK